MAGRTNLDIQQGVDYQKTVIVYDDAGLPAVLTAVATSLSNTFTGQAQLRRDYADIDATADATFSVVVQPIGSRVTIGLNAATTAALVNGPYVWDLELTNPTTGVVMRAGGGRATVSLEVTR